jgi:hypothetical protein
MSVYVLVISALLQSPPSLDPRIFSLEFLIEGERAGYGPNGEVLPAYSKSAWSGAVKFHREGAVSLEWQDDDVPGALRRYAVQHGAETRIQDKVRGRFVQAREVGDLEMFFSDLRRRELPDIWPGLFAPYNSTLKLPFTMRSETLNGVVCDVLEIVEGQQTKRLIRYWMTQGNVVRWEEFEDVQGKRLRSRCDISLRKVKFDGGELTVPVEAHRGVYYNVDYATKKVTWSDKPRQVFTTRIPPASIKINTIDDRKKVMFPFDGKTRVVDFSKPQPPGQSATEVRLQRNVTPSDPVTVAQALTKHRHECFNWWWMGVISAIFAAIGLAAKRRWG